MDLRGKSVRRLCERALRCASGLLLVAAVAVFSNAPPAHADPNEGSGTAVVKEAVTSVAQRKAIFIALAAASRRAEQEAAVASQASPESMAQDELTEKLTARYRAPVLAKYGITQKQAEEIVSEGYEEAWDIGEADPGTGTGAASGTPKTSLD